MTTTTHQNDQDGTSTGSTARLELQPAGYDVGDQVRVDPDAIPPAWVPRTGTRPAHLEDLVGTVIEVHRCDPDHGDGLSNLYEVRTPAFASFPFTATELSPA